MRHNEASTVRTININHCWRCGMAVAEIDRWEVEKCIHCGQRTGMSGKYHKSCAGGLEMLATCPLCK